MPPFTSPTATEKAAAHARWVPIWIWPLLSLWILITIAICLWTMFPRYELYDRSSAWLYNKVLARFVPERISEDSLGGIDGQRTLRRGERGAVRAERERRERRWKGSMKVGRKGFEERRVDISALPLRETGEEIELGIWGWGHLDRREGEGRGVVGVGTGWRRLE